VLIAPASGEETRADIADKVSDFGDKVHEHRVQKPRSNRNSRRVGLRVGPGGST
jgi:hypothetical protein